MKLKTGHHHFAAFHSQFGPIFADPTLKTALI